jgi:hypothetical protein
VGERERNYRQLVFVHFYVQNNFLSRVTVKNKLHFPIVTLVYFAELTVPSGVEKAPLNSTT